MRLAMHLTGNATGQQEHTPVPDDVCQNRNCSRVQKEIRMALTGASEVHHALCAPDQQRIANFEIASRIVPARHIGGDFVCTVDAGDSKVLILGDLMGKGLSAAMWITHIIDLVHRAAEDFSGLDQMMTKLNAEIVRSRVRAPLTSAVAVAFHSGADEISCTLAGHPPAILVRSTGLTELLTDGGPILGVFRDPQYAVNTVRLERGEALVAISDGVTEAESSSAEEFSVQRAARTLAQHADSAANKKITALLEASSMFSSKGPVDDASALVIQRV